jgi:hypothetical protein
MNLFTLIQCQVGALYVMRNVISCLRGLGVEIGVWGSQLER